MKVTSAAFEHHKDRTPTHGYAFMSTIPKGRVLIKLLLVTAT
jgi:hypothetical protein